MLNCGTNIIFVQEILTIMDEFSYQIVDGLKSKIKTIITLFETSKVENGILQKRNSELESELLRKEKLVAELETKYDNLKAAKTILASNDDIQDAKTRINGMVKEIDKCIALLNI